MKMKAMTEETVGRRARDRKVWSKPVLAEKKLVWTRRHQKLWQGTWGPSLVKRSEEMLDGASEPL